MIIVSEKNIAKIKLLMLNAASFFKVKDNFKVQSINHIIPAYSEHHCITTKMINESFGKNCIIRIFMIEVCFMRHGLFNNCMI